MKPRDANDILLQDGADALREHFDHAAETLPEEPTSNGHAHDGPPVEEPPSPDDPIAEYDRGNGVEHDPPVANSVKAPASDKSGQSKSSKFKIEMLDEIEIPDDPVELVQGILPTGPGLVVWYGPPKSLKSFVATNLLLHIAAALDFYGRKVLRGVVVYITSEGVRGARRRLIAARRALGLEGRKIPFMLITTMPDMGTGTGDRITLVRDIKAALAAEGVTDPLRIIVLDTLRRALPGKSENKIEDVSVLVDNCGALQTEFNSLVGLVHHSPRSDDTRTSGSNGIDAAADLMISVLRESETSPRAVAEVVRYKDGEEGDTWTVELRPMEIGSDREGTSIASRYVDVVIPPVRKASAAKGATKPLSAGQQRVFDILVRAVDEIGTPGAAGAAAPPLTRAVTREAFKAFADDNGFRNLAEADRSFNTRLGARLNEMAGKRAIGQTNHHIWVARWGS